ncbi:MAG: hypothetical protein MMC23_000451 [Stictis urceolatum]|nr:hypothetical protein [Stictis urceolata]
MSPHFVGPGSFLPPRSHGIYFTPIPGPEYSQIHDIWQNNELISHETWLFWRDKLEEYRRERVAGIDECQKNADEKGHLAVRGLRAGDRGKNRSKKAQLGKEVRVKDKEED